MTFISSQGGTSPNLFLLLRASKPPHTVVLQHQSYDLAGTPKKLPPHPRQPRRPSIDPNIPKRKPRTPHGPGDGRRKNWPRIRVRGQSYERKR